MVNTISFQVDLIRFRKYFSACACLDKNDHILLACYVSDNRSLNIDRTLDPSFRRSKSVRAAANDLLRVDKY